MDKDEVFEIMKFYNLSIFVVLLVVCYIKSVLISTGFEIYGK